MGLSITGKTTFLRIRVHGPAGPVGEGTHPINNFRIYKIDFYNFINNKEMIRFFINRGCGPQIFLPIR